MHSLRRSSWKGLALRGLIALGMSIFAFAEPHITFTSLIFLFAAYAFADGLITFWLGITRRRHSEWSGLRLTGAMNMLIGIVAFAFSSVTGLALVVAIGIWAILVGLFELWLCFLLRRSLPGMLFLAAAASATLVLGLLFVTAPARGSVLLVLTLAAYWGFFGFSLLAAALRLWAIHRITDRDSQMAIVRGF